jgi:RHS repeat-associated protein
MTVVTDSTSNIQQTQDYYPYGSARISTGSNVQQRKYIGQFSDTSGLNHLNARYLSSDRGQFISQDPVFLGDPLQQTLQDPQSLNTYSYSEGNPITKSDPGGRYVEEINRPVSAMGFLSNFSHAFLYVVPQAGEDLPSINGDNMSIKLRNHLP